MSKAWMKELEEGKLGWQTDAIAIDEVHSVTEWYVSLFAYLSSSLTRDECFSNYACFFGDVRKTKIKGRLLASPPFSHHSDSFVSTCSE